MIKPKAFHISKCRIKSDKDFDKCFIRPGDLVKPYGWETVIEESAYRKVVDALKTTLDNVKGLTTEGDLHGIRTLKELGEFDAK